MPLNSLFQTALESGQLEDDQGILTTNHLDSILEKIKTLPLNSREAVGISFLNGRDCILTYIALAKLNCVAVPLPPTLPQAERHRLWSNLDIRFALEENEVTKLVTMQQPDVWPDSIHWVMHSSGSTGRPKAIPLTLEAMQKNATDVMRILGDKKGLIHLGSMSQCYTAGLYNSFLLPLLTGGKVILGPLVTALTVRVFLKLIQKFDPDIIWVNPVVVGLLTRQTFESSKKRFFISCTAPLTLKDVVLAQEKLKNPVLQSYGLTETLIVSVESPLRDVPTQFSAGQIVGGAGSIDLDADQNLMIHNGSVFPGYVKKENGALNFVMPSGVPHQLFCSGDLACIDNGRLTVTGRLTNMINVGGVKISSEQMEEVLLTFPGVLEVAVLGFKQDSEIEKPVAFIKTGASLNPYALADFCAEQLGPKARPEIRFVDKIPRTANAKIDRVTLEKEGLK